MHLDFDVLHLLIKEPSTTESGEVPDNYNFH